MLSKGMPAAHTGGIDRAREADKTRYVEASCRGMLVLKLMTLQLMMLASI